MVKSPPQRCVESKKRRKTILPPGTALLAGRAPAEPHGSKTIAAAKQAKPLRTFYSFDGTVANGGPDRFSTWRDRRAQGSFREHWPRRELPRLAAFHRGCFAISARSG